jgi:gamma-glutamyltranspeptidase/glutathione hydrolase
VLLHVLEDDLPLAEAVARPRLHHQWMPDVLEFEPGWDRPADGGGAEGDAAAVDPVAAMEALGHRTGRREAVGVVQAILVRDGRRHAASDPRKGGRPAGH